MKTKKKPERTCIICRSKKDKNDLIRIVRNKEGKIFLDPTGKANGRGAYVCKSEECLNKFLKKTSLERAFKHSIEKETLAQVRNEVEKLLK